MMNLVALLLRFAGAGLILLALLHVPMSRQLKWREDGARMSPVNASIFRVHTFFICFVLVMMGLPCLLDPAIFLVKSRAGAWVAWSFAAFWFFRFYFQLFVYRVDLWRGKRMETALHVWFTLVWLALTGLFATCGLSQLGWLALS